MTFARSVVVRHEQINTQLARFPSSRYMGSKHAILPFIYEIVKEQEFSTVLDACSGSGAVSYLFKSMGKAVTSNDFLRSCFHTAQACIANSSEHLTQDDIECILAPHPAANDFIAQTFRGLYFTDEENVLLDNAATHIMGMTSPFKQSLALAALIRACLRRRPRGIFTYTGIRYDDGRRDLQISLEQHFREAAILFNQAVFDNGQINKACNSDIFQLPAQQFDLVYVDPPYVSPHSDNDYTRRYHFVEGLARYWQGLEIQEKTQTKKFRRLPSSFDNKKSIYQAFHRLFAQFQDSIIVVSYSSNGIPSKDEMLDILAQYKHNVTIHECDHRYSFGTHGHKLSNEQNIVKEFLFVGR